MAKRPRRLTPTLSISLSPELLAAVNARVASGLYSTASELLREALRLFFATEQVRSAYLTNTLPQGGASFVAEGPTARLTSALDLFTLGADLRVQKLRHAQPALTDDELQSRLVAAQAELETDRVIRDSPERLRKLREKHGSP